MKAGLSMKSPPTWVMRTAARSGGYFPKIRVGAEGIPEKVSTGFSHIALPQILT
jgi:hypothetical protein